PNIRPVVSFSPIRPIINSDQSHIPQSDCRNPDIQVHLFNVIRFEALSQMFRQRRGTLKAIEKQAVIVTAFRSLNLLDKLMRYSWLSYFIAHIRKVRFHRHLGHSIAVAELDFELVQNLILNATRLEDEVAYGVKQMILILHVINLRANPSFRTFCDSFPKFQKRIL
ncbi:10344_t:CDS:2, partial [Paraglomus brasilianum]